MVFSQCKKTLISIAAFLLFFSQGKAQPRETEILWDNYGVPHIFAPGKAEMYYAFGWAQMHNHANLLLQLYGQARGKAAEYWGERFVTSDMQIHMFKLPERAEDQYVHQAPEYKTYLDAFVKGVNAYAASHPEAISPECKQVLPVTAQDVLAHCNRILFLRFVAGEEIAQSVQLTKPGSNAYAIAPSRSSAKHAMLVANPHLNWGDFFIFFEAQLQAPGFHGYGASLIGQPVLNIAFNDHLGWTHTVNTIDAADRYKLTLQGDGYVLDGVVVPFDKKTVKLKIKLADGTIREQEMTFKYAKQGPVITNNKEDAYAIRIAGMENRDIFYQWHRMAEARNWSEFEAALKLMQLPMFNVVYADETGKIFYLFDGNVPKRPEGDWQFWRGTVDGSHSKYIWSETLGYNDLPKLLNPKTGFVQNANDAPWTCTYPGVLKPQDFPAYLSPQDMPLRPQHAVNMIKNDFDISFDKLVQYKHNTNMEAADRFLPDLLKAAEQSPDTIAARAVSVLKKWDRSTEANSRGGVLFAAWFDKLNGNMFSKPWDPGYPVETPSGLKDPPGAVDLLITAAKEVISEYDSLNVAWGDVYRLRLGAYDYPANGGAGKYGIFRTLYFIKDKDKKFRAVAGESYVAVIEFAKKVKAQVLLSYGNASQPGSKHWGDQLMLLSQKKLRTALLEKADILKATEEKEQLTIQP